MTSSGSVAPGSRSLLRAALLLAVAGAVAILLAFLPDGVEAGGAAAILLAALITSGWREERGGVVQWWNLLAAGAVLVVVGVPLSLALDTIGGLIAGGGAALALIGSAFGWR